MNFKPYLGMFAVVASAISCSVFVGGPDIPEGQTLDSPGEAQSADARLEDAIAESIQDGFLQLSLSEEQLTAYIRSWLASHGDESLKDPQVVLADQQMIIYGRAESGVFKANIAIRSRFEVDGDGRPRIIVEEADLGPIPMPQALMDGVSAALDSALTGELGSAASGFHLETIDASDGVLTITGRMR